MIVVDCTIVQVHFTYHEPPTLHIPDFVDLGNREVAMLITSPLYEQGKLSLGQAAEVASYSKHTFMELLGDYGISILQPIREKVAKQHSECRQWNGRINCQLGVGKKETPIRII